MKNIFLLLFVGLIVGCNNNVKNDYDKLKFKNDSLIKIIEGLNSKYIFDSITVRDIPSYKNTYEKGSYVDGEIVIVAYSTNKLTNVVFGDSIYYKGSNLKLKNPDTLELQKGGFRYSKKIEDTLIIQGAVNISNDYGQELQIPIRSLIKSNE